MFMMRKKNDIQSPRDLMIKPFIGRKSELIKLKNLYDRKNTCLTVIKGRRRVGKSRLGTEFAIKTLNLTCTVSNTSPITFSNPNPNPLSETSCIENKHVPPKGRFFSFAGLAPIKGVTAQTQRDHFGLTLSNYLELSPFTFTNWTDAFNCLSDQLLPGDIVLFDELSWMGKEDPTFVPKLKAWWDTVVLQKPHVFIIFCSSVSVWIEENILKSTAFFGRVNLTITLEPLSLPESAFLLRTYGFKGSTFDIYKLLSVFGGIPWYLEQIDSKCMADENIKMLCFQKDALLVLEFERIFHDVFNGKGTIYKKVLDALKSGMKTLAQIREIIQFARSGTLSALLEHLIECGFVQKQVQWSFKNEKISKQSLYRISDPYVRFYLKNIEANRIKIDSGVYDNMDINLIPGFDAQMALQVENLLLQNRTLLLNAIGINPNDLSFDGPYRQTKTIRSRGCQIDYLVQTRTKNLFVCEFKFKRRELNSEIISEMKEKVASLSVPRGFSIVPVLFHIGGVSEAVVEKDYFYRIIDINDFVDTSKELLL